MSSELDRLVDNIQEQMWAGYSPAVIDHAQNPRNVGSMPDANGYAKITGPCGDTMAIWLKIKNSNIAGVTFWTDGCGTSIAAGSVVTVLAQEKAVSEALRISQQDVLDALGGLPEDSIHCALLASSTLKEAIRDYLAFEKEPWKRAYRKR